MSENVKNFLTMMNLNTTVNKSITIINPVAKYFYSDAVVNIRHI